MKTYRLGQTSTAEHQAIIQQKLSQVDGVGNVTLTIPTAPFMTCTSGA
jgi:hypothetical protein